MNQTPLLILDLDETLIHATVNPLAYPADFQVFKYHVYLRSAILILQFWCHPELAKELNKRLEMREISNF